VDREGKGVAERAGRVTMVEAKDMLEVNIAGRFKL